MRNWWAMQLFRFEMPSKGCRRLVFLIALLASSTVHAWTAGSFRKCHHKNVFRIHHLFMQTAGTGPAGQLVDEDLSVPMSSVIRDDDDDYVDLSALEDSFSDLTPPSGLSGSNPDFVVSNYYKFPSIIDNLETLFSTEDIQKKQLTPMNMTVPTALMVLDPDRYPSQSKARKVCRRGAIIVLRREDCVDEAAISFENATRVLVGDRVYPGDILAMQVPIGPGSYPQTQHAQLLPVVPVVYEDDHFAIVNKPAGHTIFRGYKSTSPTIVSVLPWSLRPPQVGTMSALRRPVPAHRLDKPTSGLLVIAKTKTALVHVSKQFHDRVIQKTYTAVVNGIVPPPDGDREQAKNIQKVSAYQAFHELQVDVDPDDDAKQWYLVDYPLDDNLNKVPRSASTVFRTLRHVPSLHARDGYLSLVELKPKTGRYHQLRRHMAWVCDRVLVGDTKYDGNKPEAVKLRGQGLFLSSTKVKLEHPYYNTDIGRIEWNRMEKDSTKVTGHVESVGKYELFEENGKVMVIAEAALPHKFQRLLERANDRFFKFSNQADELDDE